MSDHVFMMKQHDLLELYQLLVLYQQTYHEGGEKSLSCWLDNISRHFQEKTGGDDIKKARNPRNAGRRKCYSESQDQEILVQYKNGDSFRCIASQIGCSVGHVQDMVKAQKKADSQAVYDN